MSEKRRNRILMVSFFLSMTLCTGLIIWWITYILGSSAFIRELQLKLHSLGQGGDLGSIESRFGATQSMIITEGIFLLLIIIFLSTLIYRGFLKERDQGA